MHLHGNSQIDMVSNNFIGNVAEYEGGVIYCNLCLKVKD